MITTNAPLPRRLQVIVLAAGFSTRLGHSKALARVRGVSLLRRTVALTATLTARPIIVVAPPRAQRYRFELAGTDVRIVSNLQRSEGLSSSVRRGLKAARYTAAALLLPVDLVRLRREDLKALIARSCARSRCVIARRLDTAAGGSPLILPRWLYDPAACLRGDQGLRGLVRHLPPAFVELVSLPSAASDVDSVADLVSARRNQRAGSG